MTIVTEMYCVYQESILTTDELKEAASRYTGSLEKRREARAKRIKAKQEKNRIAFEGGKSDMLDLDELYGRVLKNVNNWKPSLEGSTIHGG